MSRKKHSYKKPTASEIPLENRVPRAEATPNEHCCPEFRAGKMDMEGNWGWQNFKPIEMQELLQKIFDSQKLTWQQLRERKSHLVKVEDLTPTAQKRLIAIKQDDLDELFSLRLTGKKRIWGIKDGNILWLLWWDPEHEICPSLLKNT
jgi:hypothetical protein